MTECLNRRPALKHRKRPSAQQWPYTDKQHLCPWQTELSVPIALSVSRSHTVWGGWTRSELINSCLLWYERQYTSVIMEFSEKELFNLNGNFSSNTPQPRLSSVSKVHADLWGNHSSLDACVCVYNEMSLPPPVCSPPCVTLASP